jgi:hypothetical protein
MKGEIKMSIELINDKPFAEVKAYVISKVSQDPKCYGFTIRRKRSDTETIWRIEYHIASDYYYNEKMK